MQPESGSKLNMEKLLFETRYRRQINTQQNSNKKMLSQVSGNLKDNSGEEKKLDNDIIEKTIIDVNKFKKYYESLSPMTLLTIDEYEILHLQTSDSHHSTAKEHEIASYLIFLEQAIDTIKINHILDKHTIETVSNKINTQRKKISSLLKKLKRQESDLRLKNTKYQINKSIDARLKKIYGAAEVILKKLEGNTKRLNFYLIINITALISLAGILSGSIVLDCYCLQPSSQMPVSKTAKLSYGVSSIILGCAAMIGFIYLLKNIKNNFQHQDARSEIEISSNHSNKKQIY